MDSSTQKIPLKLLVDTKTNKVVFAEAKKDFIDLLLGLLQVPIGSLLKTFHENRIEFGCSIGKLYNSAADLEPDCFQVQHNGYGTKDLVLWPELSGSSKLFNIPPLLKSFGSPSCPSEPTKYVGTRLSSPFEICTADSTRLNRTEGFVRDGTFFMVMDDLMVKLLSPVSAITVLNLIGVKDFSSLVEKNVAVDFNQALELVKKSFVSNTVLSDVFLKQKQRVSECQ